MLDAGRAELSMKEVHLKTRKPKRTRRVFTDKEKAEIVQACEHPGVIFENVAREYDVLPNQVYVWRKKIRSAQSPVSESSSEMVAYDEVMAMLAELKRIQTEVVSPVGNRLKSELKSNKMTAYNGAIAVGSFVNAVSKLQDQKMNLLDRLAEIGPVKPREPLDPAALRKERLAERLVTVFLDQQVRLEKESENAERLRQQEDDCQIVYADDDSLKLFHSDSYLRSKGRRYLLGFEPRRPRVYLVRVNQVVTIETNE
jgi:transposase-like protein